MKKFEELSEFQQSFYKAWYDMLNDEKQVIVFPEFQNKLDQEIERIPGKKRKHSALDKFVEDLEKNRRSTKCIISNKKLEDKINETKQKKLAYMKDHWLRLFNIASMTAMFIRVRDGKKIKHFVMEIII